MSKALLSVEGDEEMEDGRIRNKNAAENITKMWIYKQIKARAEEFTQYRNVRINFIATKLKCISSVTMTIFLFSSEVY